MPTHEDDAYVFLASTWATPQLEINGEVIDCYKWSPKQMVRIVTHSGRKVLALYFRTANQSLVSDGQTAGRHTA